MSAVAWLPSALMIQPPACTMNAPIRSRVSPMASGMIPGRLDLLGDRGQLRPRWSGTSASVSPAFVHRSVLISSARVEKSFGTQ